MLLDFMQDMGNYEERKVVRDDFSWGFISTARCSDGRDPYETAVEHPDYNGGRMVIVESYKTRAAAKVGHQAWREAMLRPNIPDQLVDCCNATVGQMWKSVGGNPVFPRVPR